MEVIVMDRFISDFTPLSIHFDETGQGGPKPYIFYNYVAENSEFLKVVEKAWGISNKWQGMEKVWQKLKLVKHKLKMLHTEEFKRVREKVQTIRRQLQETQEKIQDPCHQTSLFDTEKELRGKLEKWGVIEESIMRQKSRTQWLKLGDSNSAYFYACLKIRTSMNSIKSLVNQDGKLLKNEQKVKDEVVGFYKELLGNVAEQIPMINPKIMRNGPILKREQQLKLIEPITTEEICIAMKNIYDNKAPGCDGFNIFFFKKAWSIIGEDVINAKTYFVATGEIYKPINCTVVTLIPKVKSSSSIKEYRSIYCYTVLYKVISKVFTTRLQMVMDSLIDVSQAVFVPGRIISDNIILRHELVKGYGRKGITPRYSDDNEFFYQICAMDFEMSYYCVIFHPDKWHAYKSFPSKKRAKIGGSIVSIPVCLSHGLPMQVAKNTEEQTKFQLPSKIGDEVSIQMLYNCFMEFSRVSGLKENKSKSSIYFGGVSLAVQQIVIDQLGFSKGELLIRYLCPVINPNLLVPNICLPKEGDPSHRIDMQKVPMVWGVDMSKRALVSWDKLCQPKATGGWNLLDITLWNKTAICKLLWNLAQTKDKLWVQCIHIYYGKGRDIRHIEPKQTSWLVKKILKAKQYMLDVVVNMIEIFEKEYITINNIYKQLRSEQQKIPWRKLKRKALSTYFSNTLLQHQYRGNYCNGWVSIGEKPQDFQSSAKARRDNDKVNYTNDIWKGLYDAKIKK
nr:uncharacterized protein LOC104119842 [Nicotiana tomentosiformis]